MADKKLQMKEYNTSSTDWDSLLPVTNLAYVNGVSSSARTFLGTPSTHNLRQMVVDTGTGALVFAEYPVITASVLNSSTISDARYLSIIDTTAGVYSGRLRIISTSEALTGDVRLDVDLNNGNRILQLDGSLYVKTASVTLLGRSGGSELLLPSGTLAFSGTGNAYTVSNGGYLIASNNAPSANEGYVLQVVGGTPSWVAAGSISGSVDITGALEISSNLTVKGNTTLTTSLNGVVIASSGVLSAGSASLTNQVTGTLPVGRGGSGATSLTGVLVGNGASAFTAVTAPTGTIVGTTDIQVLSNKTFNLSQNTLTGSLAQFNTALIGADFASLAGAETLTNKTIDLGNNTLTGSFAELNIAVGGTLLSENSTNIGITGKTFNDNGITFQDNGDNSRKMQFQLSAITAGTTVSITIPDIVSGTMLTTNNTATLTNKTINGNNNTLTNIDLTTAVTGTLPVANGGTGVTSKTGTGNVVLSANSVLTGTTTASTISATSLILANALPESEGGTGESSYTSGQILIGNSSGGLTKAFISGTTNEISVTTASGAITIGLPTTVVLPSATSIGNVSSTEIGYLDGVTSAIQTQLTQKLESSVITLFVADDSITTTTNKIPYGSRILWDQDFYPGSRNAYFEVVIENISASGVTSVDLQTTTGTHIVTVTTSATTPTRVRSGTIILTDATQYEVELRTSSPSYTAYLYSARIIIAD